MNIPVDKYICVIQYCKVIFHWYFLLLKDCLGYDRHGRKYWFIARRIFVEETICPVEFKMESDEERKTWYYSSPKQFDELLKVLEKEEFEKKLFQVLKNLRPEILKP